MDLPTPHIWVLLGQRAGDNAQAQDLARRLGGRIEDKQLRFNRLSDLPNVLLGVGFKTLDTGTRLHPPWPDIVIATARRAAPVSIAIKRASGRRTLTVHLGRPRMALQDFDLVLCTPQYDVPQAPNVVSLVFPFAQARSVSIDLRVRFEKTWSHLPGPWIAGVIGAGKFPVRFGPAELDGFAAGLNALAKRMGGSVILMDSPRSTAGAINHVAAAMDVPHWLWVRGDGDNPYQAALAMADVFAVSSDSVSMVSEMVQTGKPAHVFHLPVSGLAPRWSAQAGVMAGLARKGILSPPRDVSAFLSVLDNKGWIGDLAQGRGPSQTFRASSEHADAVARIRALLKQRVTD